ncbi:MAG: carboxypeptidase-like regulatory domain-containing protein [Bacteroidota bacterium]
MKTIITVLLSVLPLANVALSQTISGIVLDSATQEPMAYVHIGVLGKNLGVISRDDGTFQIDLSGAAPQDQLTFSSIGYHSRHIPQSAWKSSPMKVYLSPQTYTLKEVVVEDSRLGELVKIGRYQPTKWTSGQSGLEKFGWGGEWAIRIFSDGHSYRIKDINFHTRFNTMDSVLFRINIYDVKDSMPNNSLLQEELLVKSYKRDKWISQDVSSRQLLIDEDIIVSFEVVQLWLSSRGDNSLFFTHGKDYDRGGTYARASSLAPWKKEGIPITLYLTAEGYSMD